MIKLATAGLTTCKDLQKQFFQSCHKSKTYAVLYLISLTLGYFSYKMVLYLCQTYQEPPDSCQALWIQTVRPNIAILNLCTTTCRDTVYVLCLMQLLQYIGYLMSQIFPFFTPSTVVHTGSGHLEKFLDQN